MRVLIAILCCASVFAQPHRIVSTSPSITETLFALGLGDRVVGVSNYCHYPAETASKPRVGSYLHPNIESIAALKPDLVIVQATSDPIAPRLAQMRVPMQQVEQGNLEQTFAAMHKIADACGVPERGRELTARLRTRLDELRRRASARPRRTLIFIVGRSPGRLDGLVAVGRDSFLNELIRIANGENPLASTAAAYPRISLESLISADPDVLVDMGDMSNTVGVTQQHLLEITAMWSRYSQLRAIRTKHVFAVASEIFVVPGPRIVEAAEQFERMMQ